MKTLVTYTGVNMLLDYEPVETLIDRARMAFSVPEPCAFEYFDNHHEVMIRASESDIPRDSRLVLVKLAQAPGLNESDAASDTTL